MSLIITPSATSSVATTIVLFAVNPPHSVVARIIAVPAPTAVTRPLASTVATVLSLLLHITFRLEALAGVTVAVRLRVAACPASIWAAFVFNVMPVTGIGATVMVLVAVCPPSCVVTVMVAVPTDTAVTTPLVFTVATAGLLLLHIRLRLVALAGVMLAASDAVSPATMVKAGGFSVTPVTVMGVTVTTQLAVCEPSCVVAVIIAVPTAWAVTTPCEFTEAMAVAVLCHVTLRLEALAGNTVATRVSRPPTVIEVALVLRVTPVTDMAGVTVTTQVAVRAPSCVVTVMVAVPCDTAVTTPLVFTVAIAELLVLHVTLRLVAFWGSTVGVSVWLCPTARVVALVLSVTLVTATTGAVTVTLAVAVRLPSAVVTVMVA